MIATLWASVLALGLASPLVQQVRSSADDQRASAHYRSGWEHLRAEAWGEAAREFQATIDINPEFKLAFYGLGRANMGRKQFPDAITAYERCRDLFLSQAGRNFSNKADADRMMQDDLMQIDMAVQQLRSGPQSPATQVRIAELQMQKQRFQSRTRTMDTMSISSSVPAFVSLALGSAYFRSEHFDAAEQEYKRALEADPKYGEAHTNLAVVYLLTNRYDEAEKEAKAAEKAGYNVNPQLKEDIRKKKSEKQ
jgi:tetratricopeptide (TPR) repeat protein